jgi:glycosyltransferase involved in cell wall biosynthesis
VSNAVRILDSLGRQVRVVLVGAPGRGSDAGRRWLEAFREANCADALMFTGVLSLEELAREIDDVDIFVFPEANGPESRRGTLAAELAAGKAVIAFDGNDRWGLLVSEQALAVIEPDARALVAAIERFVSDPRELQDQERRAAAFYRLHMSPSVVADRLKAAIGATCTSSALPLVSQDS